MSDRELLAMMAAVLMSHDPNEITADEAVSEAIIILDELDRRNYARIDRVRGVETK